MLGFGTTVVRKTIRKFTIGNSKFIKISEIKKNPL